MRAPIRRALREAQEALEVEERKDPVLRNPARIAELKAEIERLEKRLEAVPYIDTYDLRYNNLVNQPQPSSKAVMFCIMDVSGSMTQAHKDIAKRFFLRSEEHTSELQSRPHLVCRLLLEKKKQNNKMTV